MSYPTTDTIKTRLPYTAAALGFTDSEYDSVVSDLRGEEIDRIESWGEVVDTQADADALHDGSDPNTAFSEYTVTNDVDGTHAVRTPRQLDSVLQNVRGDTYFEIDRRSHTRQDPTRRRTLPLPGRPVQSVTSVEATGRDVTLTVDDDVYLENDAVLILDEFASLAEWPDDRRNIKVDYTFGFDGVPSQISAVLVDLVHWRLVNDETLPVNSESIDGDSFDYRDPDAILSAAYEVVLAETEETHDGGVFSV